MWRRIPVALRAPSNGVASSFCARAPSLDAAWTSRPAVKARSPAPVRMTARTLGSWESWRKMEERLSHMLCRVC